MGNLDESYWIPECVRAKLDELGYSTQCLSSMEPYILAWDQWMSARGEFYDYSDRDGMGHLYRVHRRSVMPAMRVCKEWGSLLLNERTAIVTEDEACNEWLADYLTKANFFARAQATVVQAFGLGTGAWAMWFDDRNRRCLIRHYDARMIVPLAWDDDRVTECAFVTRSYAKGKAIDQLQCHIIGEDGNYRITSRCFDDAGQEMSLPGIKADHDTGSPHPSFAIIKPAVPNTRIVFSPYGQSIFADAIDALQAVDLAFDAIFTEIDLSKMRVFLSDVMFENENKGGHGIDIPFGRQDCTVFRKIMSTEDVIQEFAPALRTTEQVEAYRVALQMLGDLCGFGISYFEIDNTSGYIKTATEVSSDNSALMRNIRRHENELQGALIDISRTLLDAARNYGEGLPEPGEITVTFDDSIIQDTDALKAQDLKEIGVTMHPWEYRAKWYGEDEATARANAEGLGRAATVRGQMASSKQAS